MSVFQFMRGALDDLLDRRRDFLLPSLRVALSRRSEKQVTLKGVGPIVVRPRKSDFATFRQVFRNLEYKIKVEAVANRLRAAYARICADGCAPVIVDAGANVGAASLWFAAEFPEARIVAIEPDPDPDNARILRSNIAQVRNTFVLEAALGGEPGFVSLRDKGAAWAVQTVRDETGLPVVTVADAVSFVPGGKLFIAKIDIEGFESDVFAGDTAWLDEVSAVYIEPHDWMMPGERTSRSFQSELGKRDFELFLRGENLIYVR